jgi:hypothetical protein
MTIETDTTQHAPTPSWPDRARAEWPHAAQIDGDGPYAVLVACHDLRINLCPDLETAEHLKDRYDDDQCVATNVYHYHWMELIRPVEGRWTLFDRGPIPSGTPLRTYPTRPRIVFLPVQEFIKLPIVPRTTWGPWELRPETNVVMLLSNRGGNGRARDEFEVDLDRCTTPEQMLWWIFLVCDKEPHAVGDLVEALRDRSDWWTCGYPSCPDGPASLVSTSARPRTTGRRRAAPRRSGARPNRRAMSRKPSAQSSA